MVENDDLRDVMEEEKRRGRRPVDTAARNERLRLKQMLRQLMRESDENRFREFILRTGYAVGSPEYEAAMAAWREAQKREKP